MKIKSLILYSVMSVLVAPNGAQAAWWDDVVEVVKVATSDTVLVYKHHVEPTAKVMAIGITAAYKEIKEDVEPEVRNALKQAQEFLGDASVHFIRHIVLPIHEGILEFIEDNEAEEDEFSHPVLSIEEQAEEEENFIAVVNEKPERNDFNGTQANTKKLLKDFPELYFVWVDHEEGQSVILRWENYFLGKSYDVQSKSYQNLKNARCKKYVGSELAVCMHHQMNITLDEVASI